MTHVLSRVELDLPQLFNGPVHSFVRINTRVCVCVWVCRCLCVRVCCTCVCAHTCVCIPAHLHTACACVVCAYTYACTCARVCCGCVCIIRARVCVRVCVTQARTRWVMCGLQSLLPVRFHMKQQLLCIGGGDNRAKWAASCGQSTKYTRSLMCTWSSQEQLLL